MRISRLFFKHHFNSQLLCCPTECGDADVLEGVYEMPKKEKRKTALKPASCWSLSLYSSNPSWLKYLWKTSSERKRHRLWKTESNFVYLRPRPPILSFTTILFPLCLAPPDAVTVNAWCLLTPSELPAHHGDMKRFLLHLIQPHTRTPPLCSLFLLHIKVEKKLGWWGRVAARTEGEQEEGNVGCSLILL